MDAAREYTDREIRRVARDLAMGYGREGDLAASKVLDFLTSRAGDDGLVPESALQGRDWARLRSEVARQMSDRNRDSVMGLYGDLTKVRDLTAGDAEPRSRMPEPSLNRARDLTWNERHVEAAARAAVGKDPEVAAKGVRGLADMNRNAAVRRARTAINGAENAGRMDAMLARGGSKRWVAVMDERTRVSHALINGEVVPVDRPFNNGLMYPGDPSGPPEEVYNCRCTMEWVDTSGEAGPDGVVRTDAQVDQALDELPGINFLGRPVESSPDDPSRLAENPVSYIGYERSEEVMEAYDRAKASDAPRELETVEVEDLLSTQAGIYRQNAHDILHSGLTEFESPTGGVDYVELFEYDGHLYVIDGNHRAALAKLRGDRTITAMVRKYRG